VPGGRAAQTKNQAVEETACRPAAPVTWTEVAAAASATGEPQRRVVETAETPPPADPSPRMQKTAGDPHWPAEVEHPEEAALAQS
jgi:hypothetical protein